MPRNVDAVALFFIVVIVLVSGYFMDHGPWCLANGLRIGVVDEHNFMVVAPRPPRPPAPPAMPAMPHLPSF
ncbi:MAG: hypothetical protein ABSH47_03160 [Bryobacteraceae bacterium]|jgi:hypothetical protein